MQPPRARGSAAPFQSTGVAGKRARMEDESNGTPPQRPHSLLPYDAWTEEALRQVAIRAIAHVAANGLPGEHHFYISFRTDLPGVVIPPRLLAQYPHEMTIVLQHQFWELKVNEVAGSFSVGLSFGGVPATLTVPFTAMTAFADPHMQFGLRFQVQGEPEAAEAPAGLLPAPQGPKAEQPEPGAEKPQVVSLDAFRKRPPSKEQ